jgi:hypothetical protein
MKPPDPFILTKQPPGSRLCGAAVCAMATAKTLEAVIAEVDWRALTHTCGIAEYLAKNGITLGLYFEAVRPADGEFSAAVDPAGRAAILAVKSAVFERGEHWILWDGRRYLDPSIEQKEYHVLEAYFLHYWEDWPNPKYADRIAAK